MTEPPLRMLVVEDNPGDVRLIREMLRSSSLEGWDLREARRLGDALRALEEEPADVALLDLNLPDSAGLETVRAVVDAAPALPVVVLTGVGDVETGVRAVHEGAQDYLVKGEVDEGGLVRALRHAIERKELREALDRSESRLRSLAAHISDTVTILEPDGTIRFITGSVRELTGYGPGELVGRALLDLLHPDDREAAAASLRPLLAGDAERATHEARVVRKDGSIRLVTGVGQNLTGDPAIRGVVVNARDVTGERAREEAVRRYATRLEQLREIDRAILGARSSEEIAGAALERLAGLVPFDRASVVRIDADSDEAEVMAVHPPDDEGEPGPGARVLRRDFDVEWFGGDGSPRTLVRELDEVAEPLPELLRSIRDAGIGTAVNVPLAAGDVLVGALNMGFRDPRAVEEDALEIAGDVADRLALAIHQARLHERTSALELRLQGLLDQLDVGVFREDPEGRLIDANDAYLRLLGFGSLDEAREVSIPDVYVDGDEQEEVLDETRETGQISGRLVRLRRADGEEIWASVTQRLARTPEGDEFVQGFFEDARERREWERRVREARETLETIIEAAPVGIIALDRKGRVLLWNPAAERIFGWTRDEVTGRFAPFVPEEREDDFRRRLEATLEGRPVRNRKVRRVDKEGSELVLSLTTGPLRDRDGTVRGTVGILMDMTEREALEDQLRESQKLEAVGRLAGGVAHDFNNLLTAIMSYADLVLDDLPEGSPIAEDVTEIREAGRRGKDLTQRLLAFGRRQIVAPEILDPNRVVREMEKLLARTLGEDIALTTSLDPDVARVEIDPGQLEQVVLNLATNARDAMPGGGTLVVETGNAEVTVEEASRRGGAPPGEYVRIRVRDDGVGIPEEVREHVFEPFFTTKEEGEGTGLGLSTVYGIVGQHGGHVRFETEVGVGTEFTILFPRAEGSAEEPEDETPGREEIRGGTERILVVEDERGVRRVVVRTLRSLGYSVTEAAHPGEALLKTEDDGRTFDLVLTDVVMPEMSGVELADRLREAGFGGGLLYMTGYDDARLTSRGVLGEDVPVVQKPFTPRTLGEKVREVLDRRRGSRSLDA